MIVEISVALRDAITILMGCAERERVGAGVGIRQLPSDAERAQILEAYKRAFKYVNGHEPEDYELRNANMR